MSIVVVCCDATMWQNEIFMTQANCLRMWLKLKYFAKNHNIDQEIKEEHVKFKVFIGT
jgi:hypothetical protein